MNLILIEPEELDAAGHIALTGARGAHLINVLQARPGQVVRVGLLDGPLGTAIVTAVNRGTAVLRCTLDGAVPTVPPVDLLLALPRPKVLRRLWAQLAALGVGRVMLTNAERVERCYFDSHVLDAACYRPLLIEGLQQARDTRLPAVSVHRRLRVVVEDELDKLCGPAARLLSQPGAGTSIRAALHGRLPARVLLAVGPEGGWSEFEQRLLDAHGFAAVDLGPRTLRSDTACVALLAQVHDVLRH